jgi:hypothetical protein
MKHLIFILSLTIASCHSTQIASKYPTGTFVSNLGNEPITRIKLKRNGMYKLTDKTYIPEKQKFVKMKHKDCIHFNDLTQKIELFNCERYKLAIVTNDTLILTQWSSPTVLHRANFFERISNLFIKKIPYTF